MIRIEYGATESFEKDLKKLIKRFRSLDADLATLKKSTIELFHIHGIDNQSCFQMTNVSRAGLKIYKIRKFACMSLRGKGVKSGLRLIYAHIPDKNIIIFIELYYKGDKDKEDIERIKDFLKKSF